MSHRPGLIFTALLLAACSSALPVPSSGNASQPVPERRDENLGERGITEISGVTLVPGNDVRHYLATSSAELQLTPDGDSSPVVVKTTLGFSLAYSRNPLARVKLTGVLTRMSVMTEGLVTIPDQPSDLPLEFTGHIENGGLHLDSLAGSPVAAVVDCQAGSLNGITAIQRSLVVPPLLLSTGTTWTDSSTVPACSGSIQVALTAIRTYTVAGRAFRGSYPVIVVDRQDRVRTMGEGAQGQHRISILSRGSGSARLYLDHTTGLLRESETRQVVDLIINSSGRDQQFRQIIEERATLLE